MSTYPRLYRRSETPASTLSPRSTRSDVSS
jgi:hypothetical protein